MKRPRIGVLGGMGPAATILFQQRVLQAVKVDSDEGHIPLLIDMNPQVPSRINYLLHGRGQNPGPVLVDMARGLERYGADAIVMPCCTAHHFASQIERAISIPFINMVKLSMCKLSSVVAEKSKVGILASPASQKAGLFENDLHQFNLNACYPENTDAMLSAIESIKKTGPDESSIQVVQAAVEDVLHNGATAIFLGCSELSLIAGHLHCEKPVVDALDVLTHKVAGLTLPVDS